MSDNQKFIFVLCAIAAFCFALFQANDIHAYSVSETSILTFDKVTLQRGYQFKSNDGLLALSVLPKQYRAPASLKFEKLSEGTELPFGYTAISPHYYYDFKTDVAGLLLKPLVFDLKYTSATKLEKKLLYYDKSQQAWKPLVAKFDANKKTVRCTTLFPSLEVVAVDYDPKAVPPAAVVVSADFTAHGAIVVDDLGQIIFEKDADRVWPLASLTKLMSAYVFLQMSPDWDAKIKIEKSDLVGGASVYYQVGDLVTVKDLFYSMLIGSKNDSTMAITRATGLSLPQFVAQMNQTVEDWGLTQTRFVEPTGLDARNVSTAREFIEISRRVYDLPEFAKAMEYDYYPLRYVRNGQSWLIKIKNTNLTILQKDIYVLGSKTGYTEEADHNLVTKAKKNKVSADSYIGLVLGSRVWKNYEEVYALLQKGFESSKVFAWR